MEPISRREALRLGILGVAALGVGSAGLAWSRPWEVRPSGGGAVPWSEPPVVHSVGGALDVELEVALTRTDVAGRRAQVVAYNGSLPGPTWRVRPGDRVHVTLTNHLDEPTNLHFHGLLVSPSGRGDNPFVSVAPGESADYVVTLPADHPTGPAWYHPHLHGLAADQVFAGLYGAVVVEGDDVGTTRERVLVVSDISLTTGGRVRPTSAGERMAGREGELLLVNGLLAPAIAAHPGEVERWRVVNACTSRYLALEVQGHDAEVLAVDLGPTDPREVPGPLLLAPGNRADLRVTIAPGEGRLVTTGHDRGMGGMAGMGMMSAGGRPSGPAVLATVTGSGTPRAAAPALPDHRVLRDISRRPVTASREITFTMGMGQMAGTGGMVLGFDGRPFDHERIDQRAAAGTVERWTIRNPTPMDHPFHLHTWPMQVVDENGVAPTRPRWRDVVDVPAGGHVTVLVDLATHTGTGVYHCHILDHEDLGMVGVVDVR